ncbi:MAG: protein translocase SEC61 complex subunit gamma [Candidatus Woesearchaeota archaeon]
MVEEYNPIETGQEGQQGKPTFPEGINRKSEGPEREPAKQQTQIISPTEPGVLSKLTTKLKEFSKECGRVLRVTKKPDSDEYKLVVKIAGIGILIIGFVGFLIHFLKELLL